MCGYRTSQEQTGEAAEVGKVEFAKTVPVAGRPTLEAGSY